MGKEKECPTKKFKTESSVGKVFGIVFWDAEGVILVRISRIWANCDCRSVSGLIDKIVSISQKNLLHPQ